MKMKQFLEAISSIALLLITVVWVASCGGLLIFVEALVEERHWLYQILTLAFTLIGWYVVLKGSYKDSDHMNKETFKKSNINEKNKLSTIG